MPGAVVRVGIGTTVSGRPTNKSSVSFRSSHDFEIVEGSTALVAGAASKRWIVRVSTRGVRAEIVDPSGAMRATFRSKATLRSAAQPGRSTVILNSLHFAMGTPWGGMADKELRGEIEFSFDAKKKRIVVVNLVPLEEYVYGVLAAEMPSHWPIEALKCQAVIARTIAVFRRSTLKLHRKDGYDLCDEQHCQVYTGVSVENDKVRAAVDRTAGKILTYAGQPAHTVFSSNCGGETQSGVDAGWGSLPYWARATDAMPGTELPRSPAALRRWLKETPLIFCRGSKNVWYPESRWTRVIPAEDIAGKLRRRRNLGRVRQIHILHRNATGHVTKVRVAGTEGEIVLTREHEIRKYLGLGSLRSTLFTVDTVVRSEKAESFVFYGAGWGHGVGLCQSGAAGRADAGQLFDTILTHYFPGTVLSNL
jgi:SpoIID/LytB domain protein